ncbi:DNA repair protein RecO [Kaistella montana]|uniref:DNA repair protein RecO n=1 Tax=Kaistella montana TaxID=1849733 RepID=A0ABW5K5R6_9FLAO|nr:recombination protein O N-terminal domain-containing protein [Kaistella montana]MCQ4034291.1 DNA repair protein RecO [Kaistella montana]
MLNQTCFLLSYVKYGDNDAILHCFSAESGYQSLFAKGIYSSKNKKKPYLFPLNLLNITLSKVSNHQSISNVSKIELAADFYDFNEVKINTILFFAADFLHQILRNEHQNQAAFDEIKIFRNELSVANPDSYISLIFNFLKIIGIAPLLGEEKYLNPESGTFNQEIGNPIFTDGISLLWKRFLTAQKPYEIRLKRTERTAFLDSLMIYYHLHFTGFYVPNSLAILRQIYE